MIEENSGKFFRFKLDFDMGFGFAEAYDFTDIHSADGSIVFVYNRVDKETKKTYKLEEITSSGIALGPIRLFSYPNSRGIGAWKFLMKHENFIIKEPNITKDAQDRTPLVYNWDTLKRWHTSDYGMKESPRYVPYSEVRSLETRILNSTLGVVKKFTMKKLIDEGENVTKYYDLSELGNRNMFVQLINTYYPLEKAKKLIEVIPVDVDNIA
ncbi:MAG: hypothetical protein EOO06_21030 [Chitinophagaceae bacterium]|nr:MAG: hypothetical protein EOO06_21030 [Chitinophagaceae bacterium]